MRVVALSQTKKKKTQFTVYLLALLCLVCQIAKILLCLKLAAAKMAQMAFVRNQFGVVGFWVVLSDKFVQFYLNKHHDLS